jgi:hypothetical protein
MYIHTYIHIHTYLHTYTHTCIHTFIHSYILLSNPHSHFTHCFNTIHTLQERLHRQSECVCVCMYMCVCVYRSVCSWKHAGECEYVYMYTRVCVRLCACGEARKASSPGSTITHTHTQRRSGRHPHQHPCLRAGGRVGAHKIPLSPPSPLHDRVRGGHTPAPMAPPSPPPHTLASLVRVSRRPSPLAIIISIIIIAFHGQFGGCSSPEEGPRGAACASKAGAGTLTLPVFLAHPYGLGG